MKYEKYVKLRDGRVLLLRNGVNLDGREALEVFNKTHEETDFLLTYPDESTMTPQKEGEFLEEKRKSDNEVEILAIVDGKVVGSAGIEALGSKVKIAHRAEFGISILKEYWGLGIGKELLSSCIECAKKAGYEQLELNVVGENEKAISLYTKAGFVEFGRNPKGFKSRTNGYQALVSMYLDL